MPLYRIEGDERYTSEIKDIPLPRPCIEFWQNTWTPDVVKKYFEEFDWDEDSLTTEVLKESDIQEGNVKVCPRCCKWFMVQMLGESALYKWIFKYGTCPNCNASLSESELTTIAYEAWAPRYKSWVQHEYVKAFDQQGSSKCIQEQLRHIEDQVARVMRSFLAYCSFVRGLATMRLWLKVLHSELECTKGFKVRRRVLRDVIEKCEDIVLYDEKLLCPIFAKWACEVPEDPIVAVPLMIHIMKGMKDSFHTREKQMKHILSEHEKDIDAVQRLSDGICWPKTSLI